MNKVRQYSIGLTLFIILAAQLLASNARAVEYGLLGAKPAIPNNNEKDSSSWFIYKLNPGENKEDLLEVINLFDDSLGVFIYAADGVHSSSGGFALRQVSEPKEKIGKWVTFYPHEVPDYFKSIFKSVDEKILDFCSIEKDDLTERKIDLEEMDENENISDENFNEFNKWCKGEEYFDKTLGSKEHYFVPFTFKVPENVDVGEHTGGILIQRADSEDSHTDEGSAVKLSTRVGVRIYQTVPGEIIEKINIESFNVEKNFREFDFSRFFFAKWFGKENEKPEDYVVSTKINNSGNVSVGFKETIKVKDIFFDKRNDEAVRSYQALRDDYFVSNYSWENPRFGLFEFSNAIDYKDNDGEERVLRASTVKKLILPIREIVLTLAIILIIIAINVAKKEYVKRKYRIKDWVKYNVEEGDDINSLAEEYNIDWKILAKVNKIKIPFKLNIGEDILVPPSNDQEDDSNIEKDDTNDSILDKNNIKDSSEKNDVENSESEISVGSSIAETLWDDFEKKEVSKDIENVKKDKKMEDIKEIKEKSEGLKDDEKVEERDSQEASKNEDNEHNDIEEKKNNKDRKNKNIIEDKARKLWLNIGIALIFMLIVVFVSFSLGKSTVKNEKDIAEKEIPTQKEPIVQQEITEEEGKKDILDEKEPVKEEIIKEADFVKTNILVLNGGSVFGAAGKMKEIVMDSDEGMKNIEAANAEGEYAGKTIIYYQKAFNVEAGRLSEILEEDYGKIEMMPASDFPEGETEENIVIIIGEK